MADRYWVGWNWSWTDTSHWSDTSWWSWWFSVPSARPYWTDTNVFFDNNSWTSVVTVNAFAIFKNLDCTNFNGTITWSSIYPFQPTWNVTFSPTMTFSHAWDIRFSYSSSSQTFTTAWLNLSCNVFFMSSQNMELAWDLITSKDISFYNSIPILNTNGYDITCRNISLHYWWYMGGTLNLWDSIVNCVNFDLWISWWNVDAWTSTIKCTWNFTWNSEIFYNVELNWTTQTIDWSNTFNDLKISAWATVKFTNATNTTVTTFTALWTSWSHITLSNSSWTTHATLTKTWGWKISGCDYVDATYLTGSPWWTWYIWDNSSVTNCDYIYAVTTVTRYRVWWDGTWDSSDTTNRAATSWWAWWASAPRMYDNVYINSSSGTGTITIWTWATCDSFNMNLTTNTIWFSGTNYISIAWNIYCKSKDYLGSVNVEFIWDSNQSQDVWWMWLNPEYITFWSLSINKTWWTVTLMNTESWDIDVKKWTLTFWWFIYNPTGAFTTSGGDAKTINLWTWDWWIWSIAPSRHPWISFASWDVSWWAGTVTLNKDTARLLITWDFNGAWKTYNNVELIWATQTISGSNTFDNLKIWVRTDTWFPDYTPIPDNQAQIITFTDWTDQTVTSLTCVWTSWYIKTLTWSSTWWRTISDTSWTNDCDYCDISYSTAEWWATWDAWYNSVDSWNNSWRVFHYVRYRVGGGSTSNWEATWPTNRWTASNTQDNASVPSSSWDVIFDWVWTWDAPCTVSANVACSKLNFTWYTNTLTHSWWSISTYSDITFSAGMTYTHAWTAQLNIWNTTGYDTRIVSWWQELCKTVCVTWWTPFSVILWDDINVYNILQVQADVTLNCVDWTNNRSITTWQLKSDTSSTLYLWTWTHTLTNSWNHTEVFIGNGSLNASNSKLYIAPVTGTLIAISNTTSWSFGTIELNSSVWQLYMNWACSIGNFIAPNLTSLLFLENQSYEFWQFDCSGDISTDVSIRSVDSGISDSTNPVTLIKTGGGIVENRYIDVDYCIWSPSNTWYVRDWVDGWHNTDIYFITTQVNNASFLFNMI